MSVTIKDIAKKVGVNPSTVSRVINGTASISAETRQKIKEAMQELDYHPNSLARSLVNGSTFTIGLVIDAKNKDAFSNTFFIRSVSAIEAVTQEKGFNLLITSDTDKQNSNAVKNLILEKKVDGIILPVSSASEELVELLLNNQFPFIFMGEPNDAMEGAHWIDMDNQQGAEDAVMHLFAQGYTSPLLLVENKNTMFEQKRIRGFQNAIEKQGKNVSGEWVVGCGTEGTDIHTELKKMLYAHTGFDSIICTNNVVAFHALQFLKKEGLRVPEDIGMITFDDYPLAEYMDPPLTVVDIDTYKLGEVAANELFSMIHDPEKEKTKVLLPTCIIERKSTKGKVKDE